MRRAKLKQASDEKLMQLAGRNNRQACEILVARHLDMVTRLSARRLDNYAEAEEVAQDVFASVWKAAPNWQAGKAKFTTWLYRVTVNRCTDMLRRRKQTLPLDSAPEIADNAPDGFDQLAATNQRKLIINALNELAPTQREAIELVYFAEMNQREAADMLGVNLAAFESSLRRARANLHKALASHKQDFIALENTNH